MFISYFKLKLFPIEDFRVHNKIVFLHYKGFISPFENEITLLDFPTKESPAFFIFHWKHLPLFFPNRLLIIPIESSAFVIGDTLTCKQGIGFTPAYFLYVHHIEPIIRIIDFKGKVIWSVSLFFFLLLFFFFCSQNTIALGFCHCMLAFYAFFVLLNENGIRNHH